MCPGIRYDPPVLLESVLVVEPTGVEPATSCVQGRRSPI